MMLDSVRDSTRRKKARMCFDEVLPDETLGKET